MLLLLLKNFWWAAAWPLCTMQLAMEKAARQAADRPTPPPEPPVRETGVVRQQESRSMASDAFMKPELPQPLRELMKMSIEQARRAFETFVSTSEKTWKSIENSSPSGRASLFALNAKIAEITRLNAEANFALAMRLAESKDLNQAMELQSQHVRKQMDTFVHQLEEMRDLTAQIIQEASPAKRTDVGLSSVRSAAAAPSGGGASPSPYAPSSSFTPGGHPNRGY